jgi:signal transduction histidine kinase
VRTRANGFTIAGIMANVMRQSGIPPVGEIPWGTHFCQFFETIDDHVDTVVPFFAAGLAQRELCFWLIADPLTRQNTTDALRKAVPDVERHVERGAVVLQPARDWYVRQGVFDIATLAGAWDRLLLDALASGFEGLRMAGCQTWLTEPTQWADFCAYEEDVQRSVYGKKLVVLCSFPLATISAAGILDVARSHQFALAKRGGEWAVVETPARRLQQLDARNRQQSAIAALGRAAIRERDLGAIMCEAASCCAEIFGTGRSIIWQLRPEREDLILRAQVGWDELPREAILPIGGGSAARYVLGNDRPVVVADVPASHFEPSWILRDYGVMTMITTVIRGPREPWGLLSIHALTEQSFTDDEVEFVQSMANVLALAIARHEHEEERALLLATAESALAQLRAIASITDDALGRMGLDEMSCELLARLRNTLGVDHAAILLLDEARTGFTFRAIDGFPKERIHGVRVPLTSPLSSRVLKEERPLIFNDLPAADAPEWQNWTRKLGVELRSAMGAPLSVAGKLIGIMTVTTTTDRQFTEDDLDLLRVVAARVAPAIERSRLMESVRAGRERLASLSRRLLTVQEEERRRVAIELHDELGQILTALKINLESRPAQLQEAVDTVDLAMRTVRDLALDLRPAILDDLGLAAALRWYADRFAQQTGVQTHLAVEEIAPLDPAAATACFRIAQEALTNIARHAAAKNAWLELRRTGAGIELVVRDDGAGFDVAAANERAQQGASLGLIGMQERASLAGGTFDVRSTPGTGTEVRASLPNGGAA